MMCWAASKLNHAPAALCTAAAIVASGTSAQTKAASKQSATSISKKKRKTMTKPEREDLVDWLEQQFELLASGLVHDDLTPRSQNNAFTGHA